MIDPELAGVVVTPKDAPKERTKRRAKKEAE